MIYQIISSHLHARLGSVHRNFDHLLQFEANPFQSLPKHGAIRQGNLREDIMHTMAFLYIFHEPEVLTSCSRLVIGTSIAYNGFFWVHSPQLDILANETLSEMTTSSYRATDNASKKKLFDPYEALGVPKDPTDKVVSERAAEIFSEAYRDIHPDFDFDTANLAWESLVVAFETNKTPKRIEKVPPPEVMTDEDWERNYDEDRTEGLPIPSPPRRVVRGQNGERDSGEQFSFDAESFQFKLFGKRYEPATEPAPIDEVEEIEDPRIKKHALGESARITTSNRNAAMVVKKETASSSSPGILSSIMAQEEAAKSPSPSLSPVNSFQASAPQSSTRGETNSSPVKQQLALRLDFKRQSRPPTQRFSASPFTVQSWPTAKLRSTPPPPPPPLAAPTMVLINRALQPSPLPAYTNTYGNSGSQQHTAPQIVRHSFSVSSPEAAVAIFFNMMHPAPNNPNDPNSSTRRNT
ncbi:hypothetical protein VTL71DRAFT_7749 [Oculimacula yallundae]|uniref:J domain-containing protein n=1 Tax=Oculimacula yallundae TaxID=86028 RepID=A0ABR4CWY6_9HELO